MKEVFDIENIREKVMSDSAKISGISSIHKGEGKTYISTLLHKSMLDIGDKTLLIRVDGSDNQEEYEKEIVFCVEDLKDFEEGEIDSEKVKVIIFRKISNFDKFVYSKAYEVFLKECREKYDHILIDMMALSEKSISKKLCELCDDTILVISQDAESGLNVKKAVEQLRNMGIKIKGLILNEYSFRRRILKM